MNHPVIKLALYYLFSFKGRFGRLMFLSIVVPQIVAAMILASILVATVAGAMAGNHGMVSLGFLSVAGLMVALCWMGLAATVRRLHDLGHSGWYGAVFQFGPLILGPFLPTLAIMVVGFLQLAFGAYLLFCPGQQGPNEHDYKLDFGDENTLFSTQTAQPEQPKQPAVAIPSLELPAFARPTAASFTRLPNTAALPVSRNRAGVGFGRRGLEA